MSYNG